MALLSCWQLVRYTKSHDIHTLSGSCNLVSGLVHPRYRWTHPTYTTGLLTSCDFRDEEIIDLQPVRLQVGTSESLRSKRAGLCFSTHRKTYVSQWGSLLPRGIVWYIYTEETTNQMYSSIAFIFSISCLYVPHCSLPSRH